MENRASLDCPPAIEVSMADDLIVVRPTTRLDIDATHALVAAVDAAGIDGTVLIDLDGSASDAGSVASRPAACHPSFGVTGSTDRPTIEVVGAGCVRLRSPHSHWTIDLNDHRFVRGARPLERCFIAAEDWTEIRSIWATADGIAVVTDSDAVITTATRWVSAVA